MDFINNGNIVDVSSGFRINEYDLYCDEIVSGLVVNKVVIDPGHGEGVGLFDGDKKESEKVLEYAQRLDSALKNKGFIVDSTRDITKDVAPFIPRKDLVFEEGDIVISIHMGSGVGNYFKAYISKGRSSVFDSLVCNVASEFGKEYNEDEKVFDSVAIIQVGEVDDRSHDVILKNPNAVIFEIGNINDDREIDVNKFVQNQGDLCPRNNKLFTD